MQTVISAFYAFRSLGIPGLVVMYSGVRHSGRSAFRP